METVYQRCLTRIAMALVVIEMTCIVQTVPIGCTWRSSVSATLPETQTVSPQSECQQGHLLWNNPRGALTATFTQDGPQPVFTLCVHVTGHNETLSEMYDESGTEPILIEDDPTDVPVCLASVDGSVVLRFVATENLDSWTLIQYSKQEPS